jgi:small-conductance mechanosensitive channel
VDPTESAQGAIEWLQANVLALAFWGIALLLVFRFAKGIVHRLLLRMMSAQITRGGEIGEDRAGDVAKRVATLEDVLSRLVRYAVIFGFILVVFTILDLWPILAGVGILAAALTLAGQPIVLDYLSGILLLFEGPYSIGDVITPTGSRARSRRSGCAGRCCAMRAARSTPSPTARSASTRT